MSLFADHMILYIIKPYRLAQTILEIVRYYSKVAGYKSIYKNLLYINHFYINMRRQPHLQSQ